MCRDSARGHCAARDGCIFLADEASFLAISKEPTLWKSKDVKMGFLVKFQERECPSASIDTLCSLHQECINNSIFLPQVKLAAGKDYPRASCRD